MAVLSSVRRGAGPDGEAGPCRETQPLRTGSAAEATSCKRLVILGRKAANEPQIIRPKLSTEVSPLSTAPHFQKKHAHISSTVAQESLKHCHLL